MFNRAKRTDKYGKAQVVIEAFFKSQRFYLSAGVKLKPHPKDPTKRGEKLSETDEQSLSLLESALRKYEEEIRKKNDGRLNWTEFKKFNKNAKPEPGKLTFTAFMRQEIERQYGVKYKKGAYLRYIRIPARLIAFNDSEEVEFKQLTTDFIENYNAHLVKQDGKNYSLPYAKRDHKEIKRHIVNADNKGLLETPNPYNCLKFPDGKSYRDSLRPEQIDQLERLTFAPDEKTLEMSRDAYLFAFYTLSRVGDIIRFCPKHFTRSSTDEGWILEATAQKVKKKIYCPLGLLFPVADGGRSKPERIYEKYSAGKRPDQPLFSITAQAINRNLKILAERAGIKGIRLTMHTAKHSGITYLTIMDFGDSFIQEMALHEDIKTTKAYTHFVKEDITNRLRQAKAGNQWKYKKSE